MVDIKAKIAFKLESWAKRLRHIGPAPELVAMIPFLNVKPYIPPPPKLFRNIVYDREPVEIVDGRVKGGWKKYKILLLTTDGGNTWTEAKRTQVWDD